MMLAQRLYEGVESRQGRRRRPDHLHAHRFHARLRGRLAEVRAYIAAKYGPEYLPESPNIYKSKKEAQDAHEAIRPTSMAFVPMMVAKYLAEDEMKLYRLIWNRFVASQMMPALFDQTTIDVAANGKNGRITCSAPPVRC